jgi:hypothetical protein
MKSLLISLTLFAAFPGTTNYQLNSYTFGSGGSANSSTSTYALEGTTGQLTGSSSASSTYTTKPGFIETQQGNVPTIAAFDNNSGTYFDKLHFVIGTAGNPTDATYALSISTDNFVSDIRYVKNDLTVGVSLSVADYQTYATWGGAGGADIIGLTASTTYYLRAKVTQGKFTETAYGPTASATTAGSAITFNVTTSTQPSPPFSVQFGTLPAGSIVSSPQTIDIALSTNATNGAHVYIAGKNNGLLSATTSYLINSVSNNLTSLGEGYGAQNSSISQTSGGPFSVIGPYNGSGGTVGIVDSTTRSLYTSPGPITNGIASLLLKAKSSSSTATATDYSDIITLVAAGSF